MLSGQKIKCLTNLMSIDEYQANMGLDNDYFN